MKDFKAMNTGFKADAPKHLSNYEKNGQHDKTKKAKSSGMDYGSLQFFIEPWVDENGNTPGPPVTPGPPELPGNNTSWPNNEPVENYSSAEVNGDDGSIETDVDLEEPVGTNGTNEVTMDPDGDDVVSSVADWYDP